MMTMRSLQPFHTAVKKPVVITGKDKPEYQVISNLNKLQKLCGGFKKTITEHEITVGDRYNQGTEILLAVTAGAVLLVQGTRNVPVQYAKKVVGNKQYGGARQFIPLKVNAAGVMPIIFAQAIMFIPITLVGFSTTKTGFFGAMTDMYGFWYNLVYFLMIVAFTYFYTAITVRPAQMAEDMKRNNGFIPGIKPGKPTVDYLDSIMSRITLPGSIFLGIVAIMPAIAHVCGLNRNFASFFGGTSLLIMVGVILDTLRIIEGHLIMHKYDGLMKHGRIRGRSGGAGF